VQAIVRTNTTPHKKKSRLPPEVNRVLAYQLGDLQGQSLNQGVKTIKGEESIA
jgi:hypothetical protein